MDVTSHFRSLADELWALKNRVRNFIDDAHLLTDGECFVVQIGLRKGNRIPAANKDIPFDVHFPGREDHQNSEKCSDETF